MNQTIVKKTPTAVSRLMKATTQLRRDVARADQLFEEGLARLQADYTERLKRALGYEEETPEAESTAVSAVDGGDQVAS